MMHTTTVKVPMVVTVIEDIEVEHKFMSGDVIFDTLFPENADEEIVAVKQWKDTDQLVYVFRGRKSYYQRSTSYVDERYSKPARARRAEVAHHKPLPYCTADDPCGSGRCLRCNDDG